MNTSIKKSVLPNITNWQQIGWQEIEGYVEKLQQRIYHAESLGHIHKVRDLQRMLINSEATLLLSIRKVTQLNKGKRTAGVNGYIVLTPNEKLELYYTMKKLNIKCHKAKLAYRAYIDNNKGKLSPLVMQIIKDRIYQNVVRMALEPQWEARFEPTSYGFRPKRNCYDAIEGIFNTVKDDKKQWIFEGDFKDCCDNINHEFIMEQVKGFPQRELIEKWLKAGIINNKVFIETEEGVPQVGSISPLLVNIALHGMEEALGIIYNTVNRKGEVIYENRTKYAMVRYVDKFVVMCEKQQDAIDLYEILTLYLKKRGLKIEQKNIRIIHITQGFDFLGFNIKRYKIQDGNRLIVKPSKDSIKRFKSEISDATKMMYGKNIQALIKTLNPIITETASYWSPVVSKKIYSAMDNYIWINVYKFLTRLHSKKSWKWIKEKYFKPDKRGQSKNKWILTDLITNNQLKKMTWTHMVRHEQIKHNYSPYNKELKEYFNKRDMEEVNKNNVAYRYNW